MIQYQVINDQPIPEHLYFWKYSDRQRTRSRTPTKSKSPLNRQKEYVKSTAQRKDDEAFAECTFKPQLNKPKIWLFNDADFNQRCQQFEEQKQAKIMKQRLNDIENELKECTFQPKISQYVRNANVINMNSAQKVTQKQEQKYSKQQNQLFRYGEAINMLHKELHHV